MEHICGTLLKAHCTPVQVSILITLSMTKFAEIETASSTSNQLSKRIWSEIHVRSVIFIF